MTERTVPWSKIEPLLEQLTLSQSLLAAALGVHRNTVGRWATKGEAPVWLLRLLHLEIEVARHEREREFLRKFMKDAPPRPEELKLGST